MAKAAKTFASKALKQSEKADVKHIRVIRSVKNPETGGTKFLDRVISISAEGDLKEHVAKFLNKAY